MLITDATSLATRTLPRLPILMSSQLLRRAFSGSSSSRTMWSGLWFSFFLSECRTLLFLVKESLLLSSLALRFWWVLNEEPLAWRHLVNRTFTEHTVLTVHDGDVRDAMICKIW